MEVEGIFATPSNFDIATLLAQLLHCSSEVERNFGLDRPDKDNNCERMMR